MLYKCISNIYGFNKIINYNLSRVNYRLNVVLYLLILYLCHSLFFTNMTFLLTMNFFKNAEEIFNMATFLQSDNIVGSFGFCA